MPAKKTTDKPDTVKVKALESYHNGNIEIKWKVDEIREVEYWKLRQLEQDKPGNWVVIHE
jgi:hypothetical protein